MFQKLFHRILNSHLYSLLVSFALSRNVLTHVSPLNERVREKVTFCVEFFAHINLKFHRAYDEDYILC
jgi:hypothetical protein